MRVLQIDCPGGRQTLHHRRRRAGNRIYYDAGRDPGCAPDCSRPLRPPEPWQPKCSETQPAGDISPGEQDKIQTTTIKCQTIQCTYSKYTSKELLATSVNILHTFSQVVPEIITILHSKSSEYRI